MKTFTESVSNAFRKEPLPSDPTKLRVGIFAPPLVEAFQPSLTLPYLSAQMESFGFTPNIHNLSSLFYIWLFRRVRLESMDLYRSLRHAMMVLRDSTRFYHSDEYHEALKCLENYVLTLSKQDEIPYTLYPASQVSILSEDTGFKSLVKSMSGTLLEGFLLDYVGFTLQLETFDIIGFSANNTFQFLSSIFIAQKLKQAKIPAHLVLGGHAVSIANTSVLEDDEMAGCFDSLVLEGGGDVFAQICDDLVNHRVKRIYKSCDVNSHYHQTKGLFPIESPYRLTLQHDINDLYLSPHQIFSIHSALGCNYGACIFCSSNRKSAPYVPRNINVLTDEIEWLQDYYQISHFNICDNNFAPDRAALFCGELEKREKKIYWQCTSRVYDEFNIQLLKRMRENGCVLVNVGLESASDTILEQMKKGYTLKQVERMLNDLDEVKMPVHLYCICGFPEETPKESEKTISFLKTHAAQYHSVYFQDYDAQLANKVFSDELGNETLGYSAKNMMDMLMIDRDVNQNFAQYGNLIRLKGYPFIEDHNFLYLAKEFGNLNKDMSLDS
jgi:hypothetical protein